MNDWIFKFLIALLVLLEIKKAHLVVLMDNLKQRHRKTLLDQLPMRPMPHSSFLPCFAVTLPSFPPLKLGFFHVLYFDPFFLAERVARFEPVLTGKREATG